MPSVQEMIDRLYKKRDELLKEAARLESAIEALRSTAYLFGESGEVASSMIESDFKLNFQTESGTRSSTVLQPEDVARLARQTLLEHGKPVRRGRLVKLMEQKGIPLTGVDKAKNLGTILWRFNKQFVNIDGYGYWPRDVELLGIYDPKNPPDGVIYVPPDDY